LRSPRSSSASGGACDYLGFRITSGKLYPCSQLRELQACSGFNQLDHIVRGLSFGAVNELVALCLLGACPDGHDSFDDWVRWEEGSPAGTGRPVAELFEIENIRARRRLSTEAV
jgi:hypothetical protein